MAGSRTKNISGSQNSFQPELVLLVDRIDTGTGDWLQARKLELGLLGNTYYQGSNNGINWHNDVLTTDTYFRFSSDGGTTWKNLNTDTIREGGINLYYTEAKVSANSNVLANTNARHTHSNKTVLDNIISTGPGTNFLTDDGTYKTASETIPSLIDHSAINNLDYASSGHTGFAPALLADENYVSDAELVVLQNTNGINTGDETESSILTKLGLPSISGTNTGDETESSILSKLGLSSISGVNTGDQIASTVSIVDTGGFFDSTNVEDALQELVTNVNDSTPYIQLSAGLTVADKISGAIIPSGWSLSVGSPDTDIIITHNTGFRAAFISLYYIDGSEEILLIGTQAHNGIRTTVNTITINSIATGITSLPVKIYIKLV